MELDVAVTRGLPIAAAMASPEPLIEARVVSEEFHVAEEVMSAVLPSVNVPVALNCAVFPGVTLGFAGVNAIDTSIGGHLTLRGFQTGRRWAPLLVAVAGFDPAFPAPSTPPGRRAASVGSARPQGA